jgi:cation diffusion facilitator family transporter
MAGCCGSDHQFSGLDPAYKRALWGVVAINAVMFLVEIGAGVHANSQALLADALDFLADALAYSLALWAIGKHDRIRAKVALSKALTLLLMALWVFGSSLWQWWQVDVPRAQVMGVVAVAALLANLVSVWLLMAYKDGDANVRSVWLCSRNDAVGNVAVMVAAGLVYWTQSSWPDLVAAMVMSGLFLYAAVTIFKQAWTELKQCKLHY